MLAIRSWKSNGTPTLIGYGIRANRSRLRNFLLDGIDVEMGVDTAGVVFTDNCPVLKTNKGDMPADVIVGADGLHSAVRTSVIGNRVQETNIVNLSTSREISAEEHAQFIKYSPTHAMMYGEKKDGQEGVVNLFYGVNDISPDKKRVNVRWILS
jgi:2-polyprenyl-6-methoxyphenol hydroxylase-like FAD-dependent oxidoreductase